MRRYYDGDTFEYKSHEFKIKIEPDSDIGPPWKDHDGYGIVSDWTSRIEVTLLDEDGSETDYSESIVGVESDTDDYIIELSHELADECLVRYGKYLETVLA